MEYGCTGLTKQGQKETSKEKQIMLATLYVPLVISSTCLGVTVCDGEGTKKKDKIYLDKGISCRCLRLSLTNSNLCDLVFMLLPLCCENQFKIT